ncbi:hypothetical protein Rruber_00401 [Rhodococcus ruber]|uniref:FmdB family zinc ribbon protein n=1 Tax=Rhodococcus ruber TaxID=1830 RepID=UPI003367E9CC
MVLVDYRCPECGETAEELVPTPAPEHHPCRRCGAESYRRFTSAGLLGRARPPAAGSTACIDNPDVPGLCHVGPDAKRSLVARFRGDSATYEAEHRRQTRRFEQTGPPDPRRVTGHHHAPTKTA